MKQFKMNNLVAEVISVIAVRPGPSNTRNGTLGRVTGKTGCYPQNELSTTPAEVGSWEDRNSSQGLLISAE
jgi:hypothetical protein